MINSKLLWLKNSLGCVASVSRIHLTSTPNLIGLFHSILETLTIILETYGLYRYLIVTFGNFEELAVVLWFVLLSVILNDL